MAIRRRTVVRWLAAAAAAFPAIVFRRISIAAVSGTSTPIDGASFSARAVATTDAAALREIMISCVKSNESFHGKCGDWPLSWAETLIQKRPNTVIITKDGTPIAFHELPVPALAPPELTADSTDEQRRAHAIRERQRVTFRVHAAGVRDDLLSPAESVATFRTVIYQTYKAARALGYEYAEAFAPWEKHPKMPRKWTDYPGCELVEPPSKGAAGAPDVYWLRWRLDDAIAALEAEGAAVSNLASASLGD